MKKTIMLLLMLAAYSLFGVDENIENNRYIAFNKSNSTNDISKSTTWIYLSKQQWEELKKHIDTKGMSKIPNYNVGIIITNGLSNVETVLPILNNMPDNDLEQNKLHTSGRRGDNKKPAYHEPIPYVGQEHYSKREK